MFLNLILPITSIFSWFTYVFMNYQYENIYCFPILLLIPYFFLVSKIRSIWIIRKLSPFDTPITNGYIQLQLEKELILYAPYKGATMWRQPEYAQNILDNMMSNGLKTH